MKQPIAILDVSARDGLQDEQKLVPVEGKLAIARALIAAGVREIEITSFVHPRWIPQLADADALVPRLPHGPRYSALIMNAKGFERGCAAFAAGGFAPGSYDLIFVTSASPRHVAANNNRTIEQTLAIFDAIARLARRAGVTLHGGIACSFSSPWKDETIDPGLVASMAERLSAGGCRSITLADTVGRATPDVVAATIAHVKKTVTTPLSCHLHDLGGKAFANVSAALEAGIRRFEGALAGLGGCPYAPEPPANLDLERLVRFVGERGFDPGIDAAALARARETLERVLGEAPEVARAAS